MCTYYGMYIYTFAIIHNYFFIMAASSFISHTSFVKTRKDLYPYVGENTTEINLNEKLDVVLLIKQEKNSYKRTVYKE